MWIATIEYGIKQSNGNIIVLAFGYAHKIGVYREQGWKIMNKLDKHGVYGTLPIQ